MGVGVRREIDEPFAAARARWLAELAEALAQAQALAWEMAVVRGDPSWMDLYCQIEASLADAHSLRLGGRLAVREASHPERTEIFPWSTGSTRR